MNRNPRWSIGMIALLLATFAYTSQVSAQSTYLPQYESFDEYQSFDGGVATAPQFNPATTYSPDSYLPPTTYSPRNKSLRQPITNTKLKLDATVTNSKHLQHAWANDLPEQVLPTKNNRQPVFLSP